MVRMEDMPAGIWGIRSKNDAVVGISAIPWGADTGNVYDLKDLLKPKKPKKCTIKSDSY